MPQRNSESYSDTVSENSDDPHTEQVVMLAPLDMADGDNASFEAQWDSLLDGDVLASEGPGSAGAPEKTMPPTSSIASASGKKM